MSRKVFKIILLIVLIIGGVWYFAIKDYNYKVTFSISQSPMIVYNHLIKWNKGKGLNNKVLTNIDQIPFDEVTQKLVSGDSVFKINWKLEKTNDSTTLVIAKIKDQQHSFIQNLQVPFSKNAFVKQSISIVKAFSETLIQNQKNYRLSDVTEAIIPSKNSICIAMKSTTDTKARMMSKGIITLMEYIKSNTIEIKDNPLLEITDWDIEKDSISFNFCFPIEEKENYPEGKEVFIKKTKEKEALKVVFNGNYKISYMAWFQIMDYAETHHIDIENLPTEIYLNDPHSGGSDLDWTAEVYMPIKD